MNSSSNFTRILKDVAEGRESAADLLPLVYAQLRAIAQQRMAGERKDHTLQATALVHEAYLKLVGPREIAWQSRAHFYTAAAEAMRQILIDNARSRAREKRGGPDRRRLNLSMADVANLAESENPENILALDEAFRRLGEQEPRAAEVVRLRFYAGLSVDDTAAVLGISPRTVDLDWSFARAWLFRELRQQE